MTERPDAAANEKTDDASWKVEGSSDGSSAGDAGLGDTVVQISKIGSNKSQPKPTMGRGASAASRRRPAAKKTTQSSQSSQGGPKPSIPKPSRPSPTEDLMAPFDKAAAANASEKVAATPKSAERPAAAQTAERPAAPKSAAGKADPSPSSKASSEKPQTWEQPKVVSSMAMPEPSTARPAAGDPAMPASRPGPGVARRTRKARLRLSRIDPWSVMKTVFLFSIAFGIMIWVAVYVLWWVLQTSGVFDVINQSIVGIISSPNNTEGFRIEDYVSANKVLGVTALLGVINVIITTALGTLGAFLYNLSANILGGLELTLAED